MVKGMLKINFKSNRQNSSFDINHIKENSCFWHVYIACNSSLKFYSSRFPSLHVLCLESLQYCASMHLCIYSRHQGFTKSEALISISLFFSCIFPFLLGSADKACPHTYFRMITYLKEIPHFQPFQILNSISVSTNTKQGKFDHQPESEC